MIKLKGEKYKVKGADFRRVLNEAKKIYPCLVKGKGPLVAKNFSLNHVLLEYYTNHKNTNIYFLKNDEFVTIKFAATTKTGMTVVHALEIAAIKCGLAFDFKRDDDQVEIFLRHR